MIVPPRQAIIEHSGSKLPITAFDLGSRYVGLVMEIAGKVHHPLIQWWISLCGLPLSSPDEIPWCSAYCNGIAWELRLPRSKSLAARSWLEVGRPIKLEDAKVGFDIVVLNRGGPTDPSTGGPGHVGFYAGVEDQFVLLLGGNHSDKVSLARFPSSTILGLRRLS
jgi:uncharacterized protein (TIGR02594 family)